MNAPLVFVCGTSAAGKTTLVDAVLLHAQFAKRVLTSTTRPPRTGEIDGDQYNFISLEEFKQREAIGEFIEAAEVHGNYYGTRRADLDYALMRHELVIHVIDIQGIRRLRPLYPEAKIVCIKAGLAEITRRLKEKNTAPEEIANRRRTARREFQKFRLMKLDCVINNEYGKQDEAAEKLLTFIRSVHAKHRKRPDKSP